MNAYYLVCPERCLANYIHAVDRAYFSKPVLVTPHYCELSTRHWIVTDPHRGHTYPVVRSNLKHLTQLTKAQRSTLHHEINTPSDL